jgi:hypothetical protein
MGIEKKHITLSAIIAGLTALGALLAYAVNWGIDTQERLGYSQAQRDSLIVAIQVLDKRVTLAEKRLKLKSNRVVVVRREAPEGLAHRIFHLFW